MDEIIQIVASLIGLIIYWVLTSRKKAKIKPKGVPNPNTPERRRRQEKADEPDFSQDNDMDDYQPSPVYEEEEEMEEAYEEPEPPKPMTFAELLKQFSQPEAPPIKKREPVIDKEAAERKAKELLGDKYIPEVQEQRILEQNRRDVARKVAASQSLVSEEELLEGKRRRDKNLNKKHHPFKEMLRNPKSIRNAVILKEILDRKHF